MNTIRSVVRHNTADVAIQGQINGAPHSFTTAIPAGTTTSGVIDAHQFGQGGFAIPAAFTGASVSFLVADIPAGGYQPLYGPSNALVSQNVTPGCSYSFPAAVFSWPYVKIVSASNEAAARTITFTLKH